MLERRVGADLDEVVVAGAAALRERIEAFLAVGFSKFVLAPMHEPASWARDLDDLATTVLDLQGTR